MSTNKGKVPAQTTAEQRLDPDSHEFSIMETLDDRQIVAEVGGQMVESWVYSFTVQGKEVRGLSYVGTKEAVRQLNEKGKTAIRISPERPPIVEKVMEGHALFDPEVGDGFVATVYGEDVQNGGGLWVSKFEPIMKKKRDGSTFKNPFAYEQAISKAQRNAMQALIPTTLFAEVMSAFLAKGKGQKMTEEEARDVIGVMGKVAEEYMGKIESAKDSSTLNIIGKEIAVLKSKKQVSAKELTTLQSAFAKKLAEFPKNPTT